MRLPAPLSRRNPRSYKNQFGHVLILAGSSRMLGAAALCALAAMRSGAGLVTVGVPKSLNSAVHKKIANVIMTLPLAQTRDMGLSYRAYPVIKKYLSNIQAVAIGPGLGTESSTAKLVQAVICECALPVVVDADALNILAQDIRVLKAAAGPRILTPHSGEMARLTGFSREHIEKNRIKVARDLACAYTCTVLLKGHNSVVASADAQTYVNTTGNAGMATAGSGDVLTGMIAALLAQGIKPFEAAKTACYLHGLAGDWAAKTRGKASMIASDIIDGIAQTIVHKGCA